MLCARCFRRKTPPAIAELEPEELFNGLNHSRAILLLDLREETSKVKARFRGGVELDPEESQFEQSFTATLETKVLHRERSKRMLVIIVDGGRIKNQKLIQRVYRIILSKGMNPKAVFLINFIRFYEKYPRYGLYQGRLEQHYPSEIISSFLYLGDYTQATNTTVLSELQITHIIDVSNENLSLESSQQLKLKYCAVKVWDLESENIALHFKVTNKFIADCAKIPNSRVLVHCRAGVSRSAAIIIAYLIWSRKFKTLRDAIAFVVLNRPMVSPNEGFRKQLREYEFQITGARSLKDDEAFLSAIHSALEEFQMLHILFDNS